ncbi:unnamed protein product [Tuber aestivum]|uniref:Tyrosine--tRNA ligase n=1 Tax=Tuber aestivum TaxID=59557 RepID=A0A292Q081_9PEZI|nr:unnamed protein product [Tuber aestivum]
MRALSGILLGGGARRKLLHPVFPHSCGKRLLQLKPLIFFTFGKELRGARSRLESEMVGSAGQFDKLVESGPIVAFTGVDATVPSLHVGHLLQPINLLDFYLHGYHLVALFMKLGISAASVGDPSGRVVEHDAIASPRHDESFDGLWAHIEKFFEKGRSYAFSKGYNQENFRKSELKTNADWLDGLGLVEFLAAVGRHIRVSSMLARERVKKRMNSRNGINFSDLPYQLLQSYDFWYLYRAANCRLQVHWGSDQFGSIAAGIGLISKYQPGSSETTLSAIEAYGLASLLLTSEFGEKIGNSAGNAIWLDENLTTPLEHYQFFATLADTHVQKYPRMFTLLLPEIAMATQAHTTNP